MPSGWPLTRVATQGRPGETYNIGGNNELKNIDLVRLICRILDDLLPCQQNDRMPSDSRPDRYEQLIAFVEDRPGHDLRYAIDASKIARELGWSPLETFDTGLRKTVQWYLNNERWWRPILDGSYQLDRLGKDKGNVA